jgi:hypothetical protein
MAVEEKRPLTRRDKLAYDILAYLSQHPDAQDTVQGITEWWLLEQEIRSRIDEVEQALARLVADRLLIKRTASDRLTHYRINTRRSKEINSLLERRRTRASAPVPRRKQPKIKKH